MGEACILPHNESDTRGRQPGTPSNLTAWKIRDIYYRIHITAMYDLNMNIWYRFTLTPG